MTDSEKRAAIERYISAYNNFDVERMLADLHAEINFKNVSDGETTLETNGIEEFKNQAKFAAQIFSERAQKIEKIIFVGDGGSCEVEIDYKGKLAIDLPNGLKTGETIELKGKSIFRFAGDKIIEIQDIS